MKEFKDVKKMKNLTKKINIYIEDLVKIRDKLREVKNEIDELLYPVECTIEGLEIGVGEIEIALDTISEIV